MQVTVLAGGVGAARFLAGLVQCIDAADVTAICNVGDDLTWHGLHVCPDIDTLLYTLAGLEGPDGWGLRDDTTITLDALGAVDGDTWFRIGDRDLATHLRRTQLLAEGHTLSEATAALARALGLHLQVVPVTDDPHPTIVETATGDLPFQEYFVRRRARDVVTGFRFPGAAAARPAPGVLRAIGGAESLMIAPSNPFVSIGPLLAVPGVREALAGSSATRVAVSPIVGGEAIKGPAADMLRALGHDVSAAGVAALYQGLIDVFVLDEIDGALAPAVAALGMRPLVCDTMMRGDDGRRRVAAHVLAALHT